MKKLLCMIMALTMVLGLAACGGSGEPADNGEAVDYKIGIITGTTAQGEEEFRAAENLKKKYGDMVVTATYPDNFASETDVTMQRVLELAKDPDVKAIVFVQAVVGAKAAIDKVKETRDDILFVCGVPAENPPDIAASADVILNNDEIGMGDVLIQQAKKMGAKTFVHISFPRHMGMENISRRHALLKENAEKEGIKFVDVEAPDPTSEAGATGAQKAIRESIPRWVEEYGKDTAFYSTNCGMQEALIATVLETGAISPCQCCPSPLHGYPGALGLAITPEQMGDIPAICELIAQTIKEKGGDGSRFATWPVPINMVMIQGGFEYARMYIEGKTNGKNDTEALTKCLEDAAATSGATITATKYQTADGQTLDNFYMLMCDFIDFSIDE